MLNPNVPSHRLRFQDSTSLFRWYFDRQHLDCLVKDTPVQRIPQLAMQRRRDIDRSVPCHDCTGRPELGNKVVIGKERLSEHMSEHQTKE